MRKIGLAGRLSFLIGITAIGTAVAIGVASASFGLTFLRTSVLGGLEHLAADYANAVSLSIHAARSLLETTAPLVQDALSSASAPAARPVAVRRIALDIMAGSEAFEYVMLVDSGGLISSIVPAGLSTNPPRPDVGFAEWFKNAAAARTTVVSDLWISTATQRPSVVIAVPLLDKAGVLVGVWAGGLRLDSLSTLAGGSPGTGTPESYGYVTDSRGFIVAHQSLPALVEAQTDYHEHPLVQKALAGRSGTLQYNSPVDGVNRLGAYLPLRVNEGAGRRSWSVSYVTSSLVALQPTRTLAWILAGIAVFLGLCTAALSRMLIRRALDPVGELASRALAMGGGDLVARAPTGLKDELAELADSFNQMAGSLAATQDALRERARDLEESNLELTASVAELEAFSYSVSHDLRAPLRSIDGFSTAILEDYGEVLDEEGKDHLHILRESSQRMGALIDDMLKLSRVTRGEMRRERVDFSALAHAIAKELTALSPGRRCEFVIQEGLCATGDPELLKSAVRNLMENAWKFTRTRALARLEVGAETRDGEVVFFVRDNGVGLDMAYAGKLFQPFQRLHSSADFEGTGIGLVTVKRILARHGGRIWVESVVEQGSTFYFTVGKERAKE